MKKKLIPFALLFTYLLPLVGCGSKTCTITFDPNNGEDTFTITVNKGELLTEPESPEKTAYDFKTWRYNNVKWSFKYDKVQSDMTLKAYYVPTEYSVTYDIGSAYMLSSIKTYNIETKSDFADIYKLGCTLDHWVDQDGKTITKPEGNYGDKTLTPVWSTKENNLELGSYPSIPVLSESLYTALSNITPSDTYVGNLSYGNKTYYRFYNTLPKNTNNGLFDAGTYQYLEYEKATWLKVIESQEYDIYFCNVMLGYYYNSSPFSTSNAYGGSKLDLYLNNEFMNNLFTPEEISRLYDFDVGNGCSSKVFLPSKSEYNAFINKLSIPVFDESFYITLKYTLIPYGVYLMNTKTLSCMHGYKGAMFFTGGYTLREYESERRNLATVLDGGDNFSNTYYDFNLRPCIAIKK